MTEKYCNEHTEHCEKLGRIDGVTKIILGLCVAIFLGIIGLYINSMPSGTVIKNASASEVADSRGVN